MSVYSQNEFKELNILDAGCGTGNYTEALLKYGAKHISMFDASSGMLNKAKEKIEKFDDESRVTMKEACLPKIPFEDNTFDAVMINQVLHHLSPNPDGENFPEIAEAFTEANRVLKPSGLLLITTTTPQQQCGMWYTNLCKEAQYKYCLKLPTNDIFQLMLMNAKFKILNIVSVLDSEYMLHYTNLNGPLEESFRNADSYWECCSEKELQQTIARTKEMINDDTLGSFFEKNSKVQEYGTFIIIAARNM